LAVSTTLPFEHILDVGKFTDTVGVGLTVITTVAILEQVPVVPVTVYVVVEVGVAVTVAPVVALNPAAGAHV
jgi:hypothetical protein